MKLLKVSANIDKECRLILPMESVNLEGFQPGGEVSALLAVPEAGEFPGLMLLAAPKDSALSFLTQDRSDDEDEEGAEEGVEETDDFALPDGLREMFRSFGIHPDTVREVIKKEGYFA